MRFLFHKKHRDRLPEPHSEEFSAILKTPVRNALQKLAAFLSTYERKMSLRQKKVALIAFLTLMMSYCFILMFGLFSPATTTPTYLKAGTISTPRKPHRRADSLQAAWEQKYRQWKATHPDTTHSK